MEKQTALEQLKQVLDQINCDVISDYGYKLLRDNNIIINQKQARVMAQLVKDISTTAYQTGYAQGKADASFDDGIKVAQKSQEEYNRGYQEGYEDGKQGRTSAI